MLSFKCINCRGNRAVIIMDQNDWEESQEGQTVYAMVADR